MVLVVVEVGGGGGGGGEEGSEGQDARGMCTRTGWRKEGGMESQGHTTTTTPAARVVRGSTILTSTLTSTTSNHRNLTFHFYASLLTQHYPKKNKIRNTFNSPPSSIFASSSTSVFSLSLSTSASN